MIPRHALRDFATIAGKMVMGFGETGPRGAIALAEYGDAPHMVRNSDMSISLRAQDSPDCAAKPFHCGQGILNTFGQTKMIVGLAETYSA